MSTLNWGDLIKDAGEVGGNFEALPDGDYDLSVIEATAKVTASGKTMFAIKTQVEGGAYNKRFVWDNLTVSPENKNALGIFFSKMNAMGITQAFFTTVPAPTNAAIEQILLSRRFRGTIGSRIYNGQKRNEIRRYYSLGPATPSANPAPVAAAPAPAPAPMGAPAPAPVAMAANATQAPEAPF